MAIENGTFKITEKIEHFESEQVEHTSGYFVSLSGYESRIPRKIAMQDLDSAIEYLYANAISNLSSDLLVRVTTRDSVISFDIVRHIEDKAQALDFARLRGQLAIWDIALNTEVFVQSETPMLADTGIVSAIRAIE